MSDAYLVARACETYEAYLALGNERFEADGATLVRNRTLPNRYDANHVAHIHAETPQEIDALLARIEREFEGYTHRALYLDSLTPPQFIARLVLDGGYRVNEGLLMLLEGELQAAPRPADIRPVEDESQWQALFEMEAMWASTYPPESRTPLEQNYQNIRSKTPPVRWWLAYVDGVPRAFFNSWEGINGIGQVEDLFTHPDFRHQGLATSLLAHCVADARAHGAGPVIIGSDPDDTPKHMYASMGWRPLVVTRHFVKRLESTT
jgi:GNAT superfamily N-acetyltransferase